jgi:glycosyltransferase involved in cell wall biosynthesis/ubiquinone/menaquinone biosynthesis C-methylase UbiE/uncharacterized protein YbaR (Trm112 family)
MRVLFVIHFPVFGGPHNQALRLNEGLRSRGWETVVLLSDEPGNAARRLREAGVEVVTMPLHRLRASPDPRLHLGFLAGLASEVTGIRRIIRERSIDVVQVGGLVNPHAAIAARLERVPIVWQLLDTRAPWPVALVSMAFVRTLADVVMSTGRSVALAHPGGSGIADRTVPYFPPVDTDLFRPRPYERMRVRSEWGVPEDASVIGCVANINPQKGIVPLVQALADVRERIPTARLVLVGAEYSTQESYSAEVRAAIAAAGLVVGRDVLFVGDRTDVHRQLVGMDVFAFAPGSRGEGISTVVLEAMSSALPVVTTSVAGLPEAIEDGVSGVLVPPGNRESLADSIIELLRTPETAARVGEAARRRALASFGIASCVEDHLRAYQRALTGPVTEARGGARSRLLIEERVVCPSCRRSLAVDDVSMVCRQCGRTYPITDGIPILLLDPDVAVIDEVGHDIENFGRSKVHKAAQASHFDRAVAEQFEITRPHGTSRFYRFLLQEKFRRATLPIGTEVVGSSALAVCGGSGMDAEFLARAGASVVSSDISLGAARRTQERAKRFGLKILSVVADIEHLPFDDAAFDIVYVHDGLHHLEEPDVALQEMARVARRWVSVSEPTRALVTSAAVRAGIALAQEDAGNPVVRLTPGHVVRILSDAGYRALVSKRYAMYYRHEPGAIFRALGRRWIFPIARVAWRLGNAVVGRFGNKMVVVAERGHTAEVRATSAPTISRSV